MPIGTPLLPDHKFLVLEGSFVLISSHEVKDHFPLFVLLPFLVFRPGHPTPPLVAYLGKWLGPAVFGLLVVYCFRVPATTGEHLLPTLLATAATVALQLRFRQMMVSMAGGTLLYMALLRLL